MEETSYYFLLNLHSLTRTVLLYAQLTIHQKKEFVQTGLVVQSSPKPGVAICAYLKLRDIFYIALRRRYRFTTAHWLSVFSPRKSRNSNRQKSYCGHDTYAQFSPWVTTANRQIRDPEKFTQKKHKSLPVASYAYLGQQQCCKTKLQHVISPIQRVFLFFLRKIGLETQNFSNMRYRLFS